MNSMTGYGKGQLSSELGDMSIEIKTVNSRYLEFNFRSDGVSPFMEEIIKKELKEYLHRGKVSIKIKFIPNSNKNVKVSVNESLLNSYVDILGEIKKKKLGLSDPLSILEITNVPEPWIEVNLDKIDEEQLISVVKGSLKQAIESLIVMRKQEGENLKEDLLKRISLIKDKMSFIKEQQDSLNFEYKERLRKKINEFIQDSSFTADENRILQEIVIYSDKTDCTEEIIRFDSHISQLKDSLDSNKPIGRKLDFLLQEINREINTIASKADKVEVTNYVIIIKTELEKIREQVQNIE